MIPDITKLRAEIDLDGPNIRFGLADINEVGDSQVEKLLEELKKSPKTVDKYSFHEFVLGPGLKVNSRAMAGLICSGALSCFGKTRRRMLNEYSSFKRLKTKKTLVEWLKANADKYTNYRDLLVGACKLKKEGGPCANVKTKEDIEGEISILDNPPSLEDDTVSIIVEMETKYLDIPLTYGKLDGANTVEVNAYCKEINEGRNETCKLGVIIKTCRPFRTKTGKLMTYLTVADDTDMLTDVVVFPNEFLEFQAILREGNTVLLEIEPARNNRGGFVTRHITQI